MVKQTICVASFKYRMILLLLSYQGNCFYHYFMTVTGSEEIDFKNKWTNAKDDDVI